MYYNPPKYLYVEANVVLHLKVGYFSYVVQKKSFLIAPQTIPHVLHITSLNLL